MLQAEEFGTGFDDESFRVFMALSRFTDINATFGMPSNSALRYCPRQAVRGSPFELLMWGKPKVLNGIKLSNENCSRVAYGSLGTAAQSSKINALKRLD